MVPQDNRPFVKVSICKKEFVGLLDSGAQISVVGTDLQFLLKDNTIQKKSVNAVLKTADGTQYVINQSIIIPIIYNSVLKHLEVLFAPSISHSIILGIDFWKIFDIKPVICSLIESEKIISVANHHELSISETQLLENVLLSMPFSTEGKLSKTHLMQHKIDTGDAKAIKQRHYVVSPYVQENINKEIDRLLNLGVIEQCEAKKPV